VGALLKYVEKFFKEIATRDLYRVYSILLRLRTYKSQLAEPEAPGP